VDGEQVQRNTEFDRLHGVPTDYDSQCRPVFSGPEHKKRYYEAHGYRDPLAAYNGAHGRFNRGEPPPPPQDDRADKAAMKETLKRRAAEMGLRIGAR
jgi:hypothetical protein